MEDMDRWGKFPIYLKATAGMRVLPSERRSDIFGWIQNSFANPEINPFLFDTTHAIITSGEEEATFGWLGVNFVFGTLSNNDSDSTTYGALDMGGQSTQIAFATEPNSNILQQFTAVRLWKHTHRLYTRSFLQYGLEAIEQRIAQLSFDDWLEDFEDESNGTVTNPCLNEGTAITYNVSVPWGEWIQIKQHGNARDDEHGCKRMLKELLANDTYCYVPECAFNGVYLADIPSNMTFVAFSGFAYNVGDLGMSSTVDLGEMYEVAREICSMTWTQLEASKYHTPYTEKFLNGYCRSVMYMYVLLHFGYGFPEKDTPIIFTNKYNDNKISWTQGSILRDVDWLPFEVQFVTKADSGRKAWIALWVVVAVTASTAIAGAVYMRGNKKTVDLEVSSAEEAPLNDMCIM